MTKETQVNINELQSLFRIVELNREIGLRLVAIRDNSKKTKEDLEEVLKLSQALAQLKGHFHNSPDVQALDSLTKEEKKKLGAMLRAKHINLNYLY